MAERGATRGPITGEPVTLDEAVMVATALQKNGYLNEAEAVYRTLLELAPERHDVLHRAGILAHQQGDSQRAVSLIERSLALEPDQADCYSNLGIIFKARGELDKAVTAYRRAIALDPGHANAHSNLGVLLRARGQEAEAEATYRTAVRLNPELSDAHHNLGVLLHGQRRMREAVECFCRVTTLAPKHPEARRLLALSHCTLGEVDRAVEIFEQWLDDEPDNPVARHMLAACSGRDVPARASDAYVEQVFDDFASSFDARLQTLSYRAPQLVAAVLADTGAAPTKRLDVLDAGCGTGLCGPLVAPYARQLVGVDLSERMLAQASDRGVYDQVVKGELTAYLRGAPDRFDVIVSADTLVYFGALDEALAAAAGALRPGGRLIFTVEENRSAADAGDHGGDATYRIQTHGRYAHARPYVERVLAQVGLSAQLTRADLRMESGVPVEGLVVCGSKTGALSEGVDHG